MTTTVGIGVVFYWVFFTEPNFTRIVELLHVPLQSLYAYQPTKVRHPDAQPAPAVATVDNHNNENGHKVV